MAKYVFDGALALITGAGSGICKRTAKLFAEAGAKVIGADINFDNVKNTISELKGKGHQAYQLDVAISNEVTDLAKSIKSKYGQSPNIVIHGAGIVRGHRQSIFELNEKDWDHVMDVNLKGTFFINHIFGRWMRDEKIDNGSIVNFASITARTPFPIVADYCASKAGVVALTQNYALELAPFNIRVNAVAPGPINTPILQDVNKEIVEKATLSVPQGRMGEAEEVARLCLFLASKESSYITGQVITISGGS